ncbi:DUF4097 family beta strand repeat-containing protein [Streptomyces sp. AC512_CC834]|uniref:DUF4097 family beta strand repeat-containing protein n=1 Tax=Streptomyces sp. AC512_CC834 TaxID=2823691 RepID=UPI001C270C05|nr:DUF4097 family beta strand repeat-containing protein [Streptomyces sp. AC512_CC834]
MYEFQANGPVTASVQIPGGTCVVKATAGPAVTAEVTPAASWRSGDRKAAEATTVDFDGGVLTVRTGERGDRPKGRIRVDLLLPTGSALEIASDSADVEAHGQLAWLTVDTGSGQTKAEYVAGDVRLDVNSGDSELGTVGGALAFAARSGDLRVDHVGGPVSGKSTSGDMRLGTTESGLRVGTNSGDVRVGTVGGGAVHVTSSSGDVSVGVDRAFGVRPVLRTNSGDRRGELADGAPSTGAGDIVVEITTTSGDITLRRA